MCDTHSGMLLRKNAATRDDDAAKNLGILHCPHRGLATGERL